MCRSNVRYDEETWDRLVLWTPWLFQWCRYEATKEHWPWIYERSAKPACSSDFSTGGFAPFLRRQTAAASPFGPDCTHTDQQQGQGTALNKLMPVRLPTRPVRMERPMVLQTELAWASGWTNAWTRGIGNCFWRC